MRCIVTGGAGFLGSYLTEQLVMMGHSVVVIDDMFRGKKKNLQGCTGMDGYHLSWVMLRTVPITRKPPINWEA